MIGRTKKSSTVAVIVIVAAISSLVVLTQLNGRAGSPAGSSTTASSAITTLAQPPSSSSSSASTTSTQQESMPSSSSSRAVLSIFITIGQDYKALLVTPTVTVNYSVKISQLDTTAGPVNLTLSASSPIPGVTLSMTPEEFTFEGNQKLVTLGISVTPAVNSSTLPVEIVASSANAAANATFDFSLNRSLIVVLPLGGLTPSTLHVAAGQTVTWVNFMGSTGGGDPVFANVALSDGSATSPTLSVNDLWSHTFDTPGTYLYKVTFFDGPPTTSGVVIVG